MIEKLPFEITQGEYEGKKFDIKSHTSPYDIQEKVNELVDAVNEIMTWRFDCDDEPTISEMEKIETSAKKETFVSIDEALKMGKTELKSIWHTTKEKPMLHRDIILCGDGWSMPIDIMPETVNNICWKNVEKWCYLDDLIKENDRTRKALDKAIWWLNEIVENHRFTPISTAEKALAEIKKIKGGKDDKQ